MHVEALLIPLVLAAGLAGTTTGCSKSKVDQGVDILEQVVDDYVETVEDFFDTVSDYDDVCMMCVRKTRELLDQREAQMRGLFGQWTRLKSGLSTKQQREAVDQVLPIAQRAYGEVDKIKNNNYKTFETFNENCPDEMPVVYKSMERATGLLDSVAGSDLY